MVLTKLQCVLWVVGTLSLGALLGLVYGYIEGWKACARHADKYYP
jgi:hypothetical protein